MAGIRLVLIGLMASVATGAFAQNVAIDDRPPVDSGDPPAETDLPDDDDDLIIVTGQAQRGAVRGDIEPELQLSPADIRSYGVSSISELLAELAPQTRSGRGRGGAPVVLLNGQRVSSFAEIRSIPTEAIARVDILPEEVALKYGYRADQRVVNFVLRERFRGVTVEGEVRGPTDGGQTSYAAEASLIRIGEQGRLNVELNYERSSALYESERDIRPAPPRRPYDLAGNVVGIGGGEIDPALSGLAGRPLTQAGVPAGAGGSPSLADFAAGGGQLNETDATPYRTLLPATSEFGANAVLARTILNGVGASINGSLSISQSESERGLPGAQFLLPADSPHSPFANDVSLYRYLGELGPLGQEGRDVTGHLGLALNGNLADWQWSLTANYDRSHSRTVTENGVDTTALQRLIDAGDPGFNPFLPVNGAIGIPFTTNRARSVSSSGDADLVVSGTIARLPAGDVATTFKVGGAITDFDSRSTRNGRVTRSDLSRDVARAQWSVDLPIASRREGVLEGLGDLSINANLAYDRLSDFGGLRTYGYGLNWSPVERVSLILSVTDDEGAPSIQQLGNPTIYTSDVRVFDFVQARTVDVLRITGGNPDLRAEDRNVFKAGLTVKPFDEQDLRLSANYVRTRTKNAIAGFPAVSAAIEQAFPNRFVRDAEGQLISIDSRPVNFARAASDDLRWGFNFSKQIAAPPPAGEGRPTAGASRAPGEAGVGERPSTGGPRGQRAGRGGSRLQLAVYHNWRLRDEILIREGLPVLDLLDGAAISSSGGQPRHQIEAQAGVTHNGFGARLNVNWLSGTDVQGGTAASPTELHFSDLATVNLRLFADLGRHRALVDAMPFLRGTRLTFSVTNLFNERVRVTDALGETPVSYQPDYLDPLGRSVRISIRKSFFGGRRS